MDRVLPARTGFLFSAHSFKNNTNNKQRIVISAASQPAAAPMHKTDRHALQVRKQGGGFLHSPHSDREKKESEEFFSILPKPPVDKKYAAIHKKPLCHNGRRFDLVKNHQKVHPAAREGIFSS